MMPDALKFQSGAPLSQDGATVGRNNRQKHSAEKPSTWENTWKKEIFHKFVVQTSTADSSRLPGTGTAGRSRLHNTLSPITTCMAALAAPDNHF